MKLSNLPNLICIFRIVLIFPVVMLLLEGQFGWALTIFCIAAISDGVDGFLAKQYGWVTPLGSILDPIADKLLLVSVYITCVILGFIPNWLLAVVVFRDFIIVTGAVLYHFRVEPIIGEPLFSSKVNTFLQLLLIVVVLLNLNFSSLPDQFITLLIASVLLSTLWSGSMYVCIWCQRDGYRKGFNRDVKDFR